jgi:gluconolactonase
MKTIPAFLPLALWACAAAPPQIRSHRPPYPTLGTVERHDPALDAILAPDAKLEILTEGFVWTEGPVWVRDGGYLLFSDIPPNSIYLWKEGAGTRLFLKPAGYDGKRTDIKEPGTNGLTLDAAGRLVMCEHGNRRVARLESLADPRGPKTALAERYGGRRLNSPNDLVYRSNGDLYFTDPPYGLPTQSPDDPEKELDFQGVFRLSPGGELTLVSRELERPNGIALSPDEKTLYVANSHKPRPIWMAYDVKADGTLGPGRVFFDATGYQNAHPERPGANDGLKVDRAGNLFATAAGGVMILSPQGKHLGTIVTGQRTANCAFGDDGSSLYVCAHMFVCRVRLKTKGF